VLLPSCHVQLLETKSLSYELVQISPGTPVPGIPLPIYGDLQPPRWQREKSEHTFKIFPWSNLGCSILIMLPVSMFRSKVSQNAKADQFAVGWLRTKIQTPPS
jgi:hypothetical protein